MIQIAKTSLVFLLVGCIVCCSLPRPSTASTTLPRGESTAAAAVATSPSTSGAASGAGVVRAAAAAGAPVLALGALGAYEEPDSTEFEFPDDGSDHLARDITVWVIASAFVAFFIIKVFLEEDDEPVEDNTPPGKQI